MENKSIKWKEITLVYQYNVNIKEDSYQVVIRNRMKRADQRYPSMHKSGRS